MAIEIRNEGGPCFGSDSVNLGKSRQIIPKSGTSNRDILVRSLLFSEAWVFKAKTFICMCELEKNLQVYFNLYRSKVLFEDEMKHLVSLRHHLLPVESVRLGPFPQWPHGHSSGPASSSSSTYSSDVGSGWTPSLSFVGFNIARFTKLPSTSNTSSLITSVVFASRLISIFFRNSRAIANIVCIYNLVLVKWDSIRCKLQQQNERASLCPFCQKISSSDGATRRI